MKHSKYPPLDGEEYPDSIAWFHHPKRQENFESTLEEDVSEIFFTQDDEELAPNNSHREIGPECHFPEDEEKDFGRVPSYMWIPNKG